MAFAVSFAVKPAFVAPATWRKPGNSLGGTDRNRTCDTRFRKSGRLVSTRSSHAPRPLPSGFAVSVCLTDERHDSLLCGRVSSQPQQRSAVAAFTPTRPTNGGAR